MVCEAKKSAASLERAIADALADVVTAALARGEVEVATDIVDQLREIVRETCAHYELQPEAARLSADDGVRPFLVGDVRGRQEECSYQDERGRDDAGCDTEPQSANAQIGRREECARCEPSRWAACSRS